MTKRIVEEDIDAPTALLRTYAAVAVFVALLIRVLTQSSGFLESMCLCGLAPLLVVYLHYYVSREHERLRRRWRVLLSAVTALCCAILLSHGGLKSRSLDLGSALLFGMGGGLVTHLIGFIIGAVADPILGRVRQFLEPQECRGCGYDLTGNVSGICPECGTSVPLHLRGSTVLPTERGKDRGRSTVS